VAHAGQAYIADGYTDLPAMRESLQSDYRTTITEFRAFIEDRPDDEKWELIDGQIVLNPPQQSPPDHRHEHTIRTGDDPPTVERLVAGHSWDQHTASAG
jgi:hypothetical protein